MKKMMVLLLLAGLAAGGWYYWREYQAKRAEVAQNELTLFGNVEIRRVNLSFRVGGRIEEIRYEEGDVIEKGAIIATLDKKPYEESLAVTVAKQEQAKAQLQRLENGSRPQEIEEARATLAEYKATLKWAAADYGRGETLVKQKVISGSEFDSDSSSHSVAQARVNRAEQTLDLLIEGPRKEEIAAARAQLAEADANRSQIETSLADTELICPTDGILLTRVEENGAVVQSGQTILTLSLKNAVWVYVYIAEGDLGKIGPGMKAEIRTDSSEKVYAGQIGYISPEAEYTPKNVETTQLRTNLVYRVRIIADAPDNGLRQGMPVTVTILLDDVRKKEESPAAKMSEKPPLPATPAERSESKDHVAEE